MANVFRRYLEIVLDKASARKTEKDTQDTIDRATRPKMASRNLATFFNSATRLATQAAASIAGYALALTKLEERGGQVLNVERAFTRVVGDSDAAITKLRKAARGLISDYDLMVGMNRAATLGAAKNADEYAQLTETAVSLGRALGIGPAKALDDMTTGIGRQSSKILDNIGLVVKVDQANRIYAASLGKTADQLTSAEKREAFRTTALEQARKKLEELGGVQGNNADLVQRLKVGYTNLRDEVGKLVALSPTLGTWFFEAGNILETLVLALQSGDAETVKEAFKEFGTIVGTMFAAAFADAAIKVFEQFTNKKGGLLGNIVGMVVGGVAGSALGPQGLVAGAATGLLTGGQAAQAVVNDMKVLSKEAWSAADAHIAALGALRGQLMAAAALKDKLHPGGTGTGGSGTPPTPDEIRKAEDARLKALLEGKKLGVLTNAESLELFKIYIASNKALNDGNLTIEERIRQTERAKQAEGALGGLGAPNLIRQEQRIRLPGSLGPIGPHLKFPPRGLGAAGSFFVDNFDAIASASQSAAAGMESAFTEAFLTIGDKGRAFEELEAERNRRLVDASTQAEKDKVQQWYAIERKNAEALNGLWETLARGFAGSILSGIAQVAGAKAAENLAKALAATGDGLLGNPAGFVAAGHFAAAAAAWTALAGIVGAGASAIGGGGGASSFRSSDSISSSIDRTDKGGLEIHLHIDGVDPNNPRHQRAVGEAVRDYQQRYGTRITVNG